MIKDLYGQRRIAYFDPSTKFEAVELFEQNEIVEISSSIEDLESSSKQVSLIH